MIDNRTLYENRRVPPGYYYAELVSVSTEDAGFDFPKTLVRVRILPNQGARKNTVLSVIIHPVEEAKYYMKNFIHTYPAWDDINEQPRLGKIGSIEVYDAEYNMTKYSAVKFIYQPEPVRRTSLRLWKKLNRENY